MKIKALLSLSICTTACAVHADPGTAAAVAAQAVAQQLQAGKKATPYAAGKAGDHSTARTEVQKMAAQLTGTTGQQGRPQ